MGEGFEEILRWILGIQSEKTEAKDLANDGLGSVDGTVVVRL